MLPEAEASVATTTSYRTETPFGAAMAISI